MVLIVAHEFLILNVAQLILIFQLGHIAIAILDNPLCRTYALYFSRSMLEKFCAFFCKEINVSLLAEERNVPFSFARLFKSG